MAILAVIISVVTAIASVVRVVLDILDKIGKAFLLVIANSKLFVTVLLIGIAITIWYFMNNIMDDIFAFMTGIDISNESIDGSFLGKFCTPSLLVNFSKEILSGVITYYTVFASGIGYSILVKIHAIGSRSVVV